MNSAVIHLCNDWWCACEGALQLPLQHGSPSTTTGFIRPSLGYCAEVNRVQLGHEAGPPEWLGFYTRMQWGDKPWWNFITQSVSECVTLQTGKSGIRAREWFTLTGCVWDVRAAGPRALKLNQTFTLSVSYVCSDFSYNLCLEIKVLLEILKWQFPLRWTISVE